MFASIAAAVLLNALALASAWLASHFRNAMNAWIDPVIASSNNWKKLARVSFSSQRPRMVAYLETLEQRVFRVSRTIVIIFL